jgi:hypothetical protein
VKMTLSGFKTITIALSIAGLFTELLYCPFVSANDGYTVDAIMKQKTVETTPSGHAHATKEENFHTTRSEQKRLEAEATADPKYWFYDYGSSETFCLTPDQARRQKLDPNKMLKRCDQKKKEAEDE